MNRNREQWLTELAKEAEPVFKGFRLRDYRVTCGWPSSGGMAASRRVLGECHGYKSSKAGLCEIFVSPTLDKPLDVAGTVLHELAHVVCGTEAAHGKEFVKVCRVAGLTKGKPRSVMPGDLLNEKLQRLIDKLGPYPHSALVPVLRAVKPSNQVSLRCPRCTCVITITRKWLETAGMPSCGCGTPMEAKTDDA